MKLCVKSFSINHIEGSIADECDTHPWSFCSVYCFPEEQNKWKTWSLINNLSNQGGRRFMCFGDLNVTLSESEKQGGICRTASQLAEGRNMLVMCDLTNLGFEGYPFTWTNGRRKDENVQCRLDRCLAKEEFINRFSSIRVYHLGRFGSDHATIKIQLEDNKVAKNRRRRHIFKFEEAWSRDPDYEGKVAQLWNQIMGDGVQKTEARKV